jgi:hypothetical protein
MARVLLPSLAPTVTVQEWYLILYGRKGAVTGTVESLRETDGVKVL